MENRHRDPHSGPSSHSLYSQQEGWTNIQLNFSNPSIATTSDDLPPFPLIREVEERIPPNQPGAAQNNQ